MKVKNDNKATGNTTVVNNTSETSDKKVVKNASLLRKAIAIIITFVVVVLLMAETYTFVTWFVPWISIRMFQLTGISVADGLTFSEFSVGDTVVMIMMWLLPSLAMVGITSACQWAIIKWVIGKLKKICKNAFFGKYPNVNNNNTNNKTL